MPHRQGSPPPGLWGPESSGAGSHRPPTGAIHSGDIAAACGATSRDVWPYLKRGVQAGTLCREHTGKGAPYRRVS